MLKTVTIFALLLRLECQSINSFTLAYMDINIINRVISYIPKVIKNTTRSFHSQLIKLKTYSKDESTCPVFTEKIRISKNIIMSSHKHSFVFRYTVSRYVKQTLKAVGINTSLFSAHSTRHSHSSTTFMEGLSLTDIVKKEGGNQHQHLGNFIMLFYFANTLRRIYVIKKYDN